MTSYHNITQFQQHANPFDVETLPPGSIGYARNNSPGHFLPGPRCKGNTVVSSVAGLLVPCM